MTLVLIFKSHNISYLYITSWGGGSLSKDKLLGILEEHKQEYEFPKNYWESTLLEALSEAIKIVQKDSTMVE